MIVLKVGELVTYYNSECVRAFKFAQRCGVINENTTAEELFEILSDLIEPRTVLSERVILKFCYRVKRD